MIADCGLGRILKSAIYNQKSEAGSSLAWTAIFLSVVVLPLLTLVVDGGRLLYVQGRLQAAADAACEDAAWSGADRRTFRSEGLTTLSNDWYTLAVAQSTFNQTLSEQAAKRYAANLIIHPDAANASVYCSAVASVPLATTGGLLWSPVTIRVQSAARFRFTR